MTKTIAIIGLGYVGLPLAMEFGKHYPTIGIMRPSAIRRVFRELGLRHWASRSCQDPH